MLYRCFVPAFAVGTMLLAGCADQGGLMGNNLTTASVDPAASKADPACAPLAQQINTLRSEGIADKVAKASIKKYKMTTADLAKADQLNKANADFQARCATVQAQAPAPAPAAPAPVASAADAATAKVADAAANKATAAVSGAAGH